MSAYTKELLKNWRETLTDNHKRTYIQFSVILIIFTVVSFGMTILNLFTGFNRLALITFGFGVLTFLNIILLSRGGILEKAAKVLFSVEIIAMFSAFVIVGEPEGFSANWSLLLPACGMILFGMRLGTIMAAVQWVILLFLLWTPIGQSLLQYDYTNPFLMRFPVLYFSFYLVGLFFEFVRSITQAELEKARDDYKELYKEEGFKTQLEQKLNTEIMQILATEYSSVFYVDLQTGEIVPYSISEAGGVAVDADERDEGGIYASSAAEQLFMKGLSYTESYERFLDTIVYEEDRPMMAYYASLHNIAHELEHENIAYVTFRRHVWDEVKYWEMKFISIGDDSGATNAAALAFADRDTAARREKERQIELEHALEQARDANEAKNNFLFNMSHDIRTPMNAVLGFTEMAKKYRDNPSRLTDCLDKVTISGTHLMMLINDVLDMSRIESGKVVITPQNTNLIDYANQIVLMLKNTASDNRLLFISDFDSIIDVNVSMDVLHMNQILLNVIGNAIKYTMSGGTVKFTVRQIFDLDNGTDPSSSLHRPISTSSFDFFRYEFVVEDTGIGMSEDFLMHIYEPFSREQTTTVSGIQGTGLGMSITHRLIDMMGGSIKIESRQGYGTSVFITLSLPRATEIDENADNKEAEARPVAGSKILLVEDNELNREIAVDLLEEMDLVVDEAVDGSDAVSRLRVTGPDYYDLVLMDIQMPKMNGIDATKAIREMDGFANLPIVAMTANAFDEDRRIALEAGMNEHLTKPIDSAKLTSLLCRFLGER